MFKGREKISMGAFAAAVALCAAGAAGLWASHALAQTSVVAGPFTEAQAQAGQAIYAGRCASCHEAGGETIRLIGAGFTDVWRARTTRDLYTRIKTTMPFGNPGSLSDAEVTSVIAYILKSNGAAAGTAALTPATAVAINTIIAARRVVGVREVRDQLCVVDPAIRAA